MTDLNKIFYKIKFYFRIEIILFHVITLDCMNLETENVCEIWLFGGQAFTNIFILPLKGSLQAYYFLH